MNTPAFSTSKAISREAAPYHLAVVGGGIVGRTCALQLAQVGLYITHIVPPVPASTPTGSNVWDARVYAFLSSSQALLEQLRVWPALNMTRVQPVHDIRIFDDGAAVHGEHAHSDLHFSTYAADTSQLARITESSLVERVLETALHFTHTAQSFPHTATGFEVEADAVKLTLTDGQTTRAEYVIDADDKHSWVREQTGIQTEAKPYRQFDVVANFQTEHWHRDTA